MAITPGYITNAEGEEEYIDKGAVTSVQYNTEVDRKYQEAKAEEMKNDYVEWPTKVSGIESGL